MDPHARADTSSVEIGRLLRRHTDAVAHADRLKLTLWSGDAVRNPELIDLTVQRSHCVIGRNIAGPFKKLPNDAPKLLTGILYLFRADVGDRLDERARVSLTFDRQLALNLL